MKYIIFNVNEIDKINFNEVKETSKDTLRKSLDKTKTFVKWDENETPSFVSLLLTAEGPYSEEQIIDIINNDIWTDFNYSMIKNNTI